MIDEINNIKCEKSNLKNFGIIIGVILLVISGLLYWKEESLFQLFLIIGFIFFILGFSIPFILKPIYLSWMIFSIILGWLMTRLILSLLFYAILTPISLVSRILGKKFLELKFDKKQNSYWNIKPSNSLTKSNYEKQF